MPLQGNAAKRESVPRGELNGVNGNKGDDGRLLRWGSTQVKAPSRRQAQGLSRIRVVAVSVRTDEGQISLMAVPPECRLSLSFRGVFR